jgi:hypothetical protein
MHSKAIIHAWLGAALQHLAPDAEVWGGGRRTEELLIERHRVMSRRIGLFECVGSTPMARYARSSRINKNQVAAYIEEPQWVPWHGRIFFVLGHPAPAASALPVRDASHFLRCIRLNDAVAHIARTGSGTVNSDLLDALEDTPSSENPHCVAITLSDALRIVAAESLVRPMAVPASFPGDRQRHFGPAFGWMGRPTPLCVEIDSA